MDMVVLRQLKPFGFPPESSHPAVYARYLDLADSWADRLVAGGPKEPLWP
jgi:hypothetical protein